MSESTPLGEIFSSSAPKSASTDTSSSESEESASAPTEASTTEEKSSEKITQDRPESSQEPVEKKDPVAKKAKPKEETESGESEEKVAKDAKTEPVEKTEKKQPDSDPYEKRWKDTVAWAQREQQSRQQLESNFQQQAQELATLKKMVADPNYDPTTDPALQGPSPEQIAATSVEVGKTLASREAAYSQFGKEEVDGVLNEFHQLFGKNSAVQAAVRESHSPVMRALEIYADFQFRSKYGHKPNDMYENIKKEVIASETKRIRAELLAEITAGGEKKAKTVHGLSNARGGNGTERGNSKSPGGTSLKQLFPL